MHSERKVYSPGMQNNICSLARIQTKTSHGRVYLISHKATTSHFSLFILMCIKFMLLFWQHLWKKNSVLHNFLRNKFVTFFLFFFWQGSLSWRPFVNLDVYH